VTFSSWPRGASLKRRLRIEACERVERRFTFPDDYHPALPVTIIQILVTPIHSLPARLMDQASLNHYFENSDELLDHGHGHHHHHHHHHQRSEDTDRLEERDKEIDRTNGHGEVEVCLLMR
jgi:hypothetical protein